MQRRGILTTVGTALLGGCMGFDIPGSSGNNGGEPTETTSPDESNGDSTETTDSPTTTPSTTEEQVTADGGTTTEETRTTEADATQESTTAKQTTQTERESISTVPLGRWHQISPWAVTVDGYDLRKTVEDTRNFVTFQMPEGDQLLLATIRFKNNGSTVETVPRGDQVAAIVEDEVYPGVNKFPHPARDGEFNLQWSEYASQSNLSHLSATRSGPDVRPDVTVGLWFGAVIPADASPGQFQLALDPNGNGRYTRRWES